MGDDPRMVSKSLGYSSRVPVCYLGRNQKQDRMVFRDLDKNGEGIDGANETHRWSVSLFLTICTFLAFHSGYPTWTYVDVASVIFVQLNATE